jgi:23S rRNA pseudouridine2605 synthase
VSEAAPKAKKAATKKTAAKADKGRDLVTEVPGATEVAEVLADVAADAVAAKAESAAEAVAADHEDDSEESEDEAEIPVFDGPAPKLERLQKILAKAGISSRRKAEELILGGRVQINGKVIMELGTKADMARDHVRVDGKLLQGAERIRYFVLNKPKGFVTTVSDPEGRPTVMQFFAGERERLYPVGRLDYLSEGLLLVTNDGELANKLTKAASGVEKTYLVKVAGQPTEDMLDVLRGGVVIERGRPGTNMGRVRTAPAKIRQVREGDNPWYEVIIIEGRNRELRKMFEEIGHHVEKIRRVGYGPLVLDLEPGKLRELEPEEVHTLRLVADGKLKPKRRRGPAVAQLPTVAGKTVRYKKADGKPGYEPRTKPAGRTDSKPEFNREPRAGARPSIRAPFKPVGEAGARPAFKSAFKPEFRQEGGSDSRPMSAPGARPTFRKEGGKGRPSGRPEFRSGSGSKPGFKSGFSGGKDFGGRGGAGGKSRRPEPPVEEYVLPMRKTPPDSDGDSEFNPDYQPGFRTGGKPPAFRSEGRPAGKVGFRQDGPRPGSRPGSGPYKPRDSDSRGGGRPFSPAGERPKFSAPENAPDAAASSDETPRKPMKLGIEPILDRPRQDRPRQDRPREERPRGGFDRPGGGKSFRPPFRPGGAGRSSEGRSGEGRSSGPREGGFNSGGPRAGGFAGGKPFRPAGAGRPTGDRPQQFGSGRPEGGRPSGDRPFRPQGDRPFAGKPFAGGAKPFRPRTDDRSGGPSGDRGFRPRSDDRPDRGAAGGRPPYRPNSDRAGSGRPSSGRPSFGRPGANASSFSSRPPRTDSRSGGDTDRPREFRPRESGPRDFKPGGKKFGPGAGKSATGQGRSGKTGADGAPRIKERWRNSFTGKNKGRPKPKDKKDE